MMPPAMRQRLSGSFGDERAQVLRRVLGSHAEAQPRDHVEMPLEARVTMSRLFNLPARCPPDSVAMGPRLQRWRRALERVRNHLLARVPFRVRLFDVERPHKNLLNVHFVRREACMRPWERVVTSDSRTWFRRSQSIERYGQSDPTARPAKTS